MRPIDVSTVPDHTWYGRALRLPLRLIPPGIALPILQGPLRGSKWIIDSSVGSCWLGSYEFPKCSLLKQRVWEGSVFFDIGAQAGYHTLLASNLAGARGTVYAFEPAPRNLRYLRMHVAMHGLKNVEVVEAAVADCKGPALFDCGQSPVAGRLSKDGTVAVRCLTLDEEVLAGRLPMPDFLKIDVEGAEARVLRGARTILTRRHPEIFLDTHEFLGGEFSSVHSECCRFLAELGYRMEPIGSPQGRYAREIHAWPAARQETGSA